MLSVSTIKPISFSEATLNIKRHFCSRLSYTDLNFWWMKNGFHARINVFSGNCRTQFKPLKSSFTMRQHSAKIIKSWSQLFKYVITDRFRRSLQLISLYNRWWGDFMSKLLLRRVTSELLKRRKIYISACSIPVFLWEKNRISDEEMNKLELEIDNAKKFYKIDSTEANDTTPTDVISLNSDCECNRCKHLSYDGWSRLYSDPNLKIWRKEHVDHPGEGLYVYKVFGDFPDVTAADFFRVQIDIDYRKKWDSNSVDLNIVESDSKSNSDVLYWEFLFPRMFYNRDYVCNRRFSVNSDKKLFTIICESINHPNCPEKPPIHRVKEYWSHTVIRSTANSPDELGIEFTITYFDNPEVSIPGYVTLWYTVVGMPDYIKQQRAAALKLGDLRATAENNPPIREVTSEMKNRREKQQTPEKRVLLL